MNKQQVRNMVTDVLREEKRKGALVQSASVLDRLPDVIDTVEVDKKYLYACVKEAFGRSNPVNSVLGVFGLRIIREEDAQRIVQHDSSGEQSANAFKVNERELRKVVSAIGSELAESEKENQEKEASYIEKINDLTRKLDSGQSDFSQSRREYEMAVGAVADRLQFVFSQIGKDHGDDAVAAQLRELLTDLGMEIFWSAEGAAVPEGAMFQFLKTDEPGNHKMKPCIMQNNRVIAQGVIFVSDTDDKEKE